MSVTVRRGSRAHAKYRSLVSSKASATAGVAGIPGTPSHDLVYMGGRTIPDLMFKTLYIAGATWDSTDIRNIDQSVAAALSDPGLENVMQQYFNIPITAKFDGSLSLDGDKPDTLSRAHLEQMLQRLYQSKRLGSFVSAVTVFNFALPRGTELTDEAAPASSARRRNERTIEPEHEAVLSSDGLAGFHGSTNFDDVNLYYTAAVFSEGHNGIVAFDEPWKNIAATFYHELNEARTDPDVSMVLKGGPDGLLGWISGQGEECGDFPIEEADPLSLVFQEVQLAAGGTAPVQFQYSNRLHGPEGPAVFADVEQPNQGSKRRAESDGAPAPLLQSGRPADAGDDRQSSQPARPKVGAVLRAAIESALGPVGPGRHDQTHSSDAYGVSAHYKSP